MSAIEMFEAGSRQREAPWGAAASVGLHLGFAAALILVSPLKPLLVPPPAPVSVEIVTPSQFAALESPSPLSPRAAPIAPEAAAPAALGEDRLPSEAPVSPPLSKTLRATQFYAAGILKEPGMERIRRTLDTFAPGERLVQLCNIEGLEQIKRAAPQYAPDTLVSYAMADNSIAGLTLIATGGAFRSRRKWYGIALKCTVGADLQSVTGFEFTLGAPIPQNEWDDHNLNTEDADE
jgi:uncharacterized protein DUF930